MHNVVIWKGAGLGVVAVTRAVDVGALAEQRARHPEAVAHAAWDRKRRPLVGEDGKLMVVAIDHPARGVLGTRLRPLAMADRGDLLERVLFALGRPGVDGVLASPDIVDDLLLLGALDGKVVIGSMNRGGIAGSVFEMDDRFTGYDVPGITRLGLDGGKMLVRVDPSDPATAALLAASGEAVSDLAERGLMAMIEPFWMSREDGRPRAHLAADAMMRALTVASALGTTSAHSWLKVPIVDEMERVMAASTLPALVLGGDVSHEPEAVYERWEAAVRLPTVRGLAIGRSLLYPYDDDVAAAVDTAVRLLRPGTAEGAQA